MAGYWAITMRVIKEADVVLFVLDARMPELSNNLDLEKTLLSKGVEVIKVYNKIDLISRKRQREISKEDSNAYLVSVKENIGVKSLRNKLLTLSRKCNEPQLIVGLVGYPNVGKSALINLLGRSSKTKVSSKAGTTTGPQWVSSSKLKFLDVPGVIPSEDDEVKLGMLGAKNAEKLRDPYSVAIGIIKLLKNEDLESLENYYGLKHDFNRDEEEIIQAIGFSRKLMKKGGLIDEERVILTIVRDWQHGRLTLKD